MEKKHKYTYETPATVVVEVRSESILCLSVTQAQTLFLGALEPASNGIDDYNPVNAEVW